jgi:AmiR/NasT family two-component response regulator
LLPRLRSALASRVVVEQAKGLLLELLDIPVADAFALLRAYARSSGAHLSELARTLISEPNERIELVAALAQFASAMRTADEPT